MTTTEIIGATVAVLCLSGQALLVVRQKLRNAHHEGFMKGVECGVNSPRASAQLLKDTQHKGKADG